MELVYENRRRYINTVWRIVSGHKCAINEQLDEVTGCRHWKERSKLKGICEKRVPYSPEFNYQRGNERWDTMLMLYRLIHSHLTRAVMPIVVEIVCAIVISFTWLPLHYKQSRSQSLKRCATLSLAFDCLNELAYSPSLRVRLQHSIC